MELRVVNGIPMCFEKTFDQTRFQYMTSTGSNGQPVSDQPTILNWIEDNADYSIAQVITSKGQNCKMTCKKYQYAPTTCTYTFCF